MTADAPLEFDALPRRALTGIPVVVADRGQAVGHLIDLARAGRPGDVHLANSYVMSLAARDPEYRRILIESAAVYPDGKPLSWASRLLPGPRLSQVRGPSLFPDVLDRGRARGVRHYLLGNTDEVLEMMRRELERRFPGVLIVGTHKSYFRPMTDEEQRAQDDDIRAADPDIVWVGLGTPLQDAETRRLAREVGVLAIGVGVVFDFVAGTKAEAPAWTTRLGVEWLFRLCSEPRRLWRRYLVGNAVFLWAVLRQLASRTRS
ncbi:WecB/TagA/CpsF family glycosyltransferase [Curtobacterium sp. 1310]|uniref:WecB/TagA/CpsF family glycosyltransferase n=1 Tax=Curtobacterium sp. 1310 TaxID=2806570 RepID=UPI001AE3BEBF|nr:WecB/TagA/CpsF family glycosyltransferase [Curtobacterium sp. 1310]MBP1301391.1 N-acetylglucosaminyldiphosphoundecaprenol N-acetyl-beta-D-mannosaminyltransferase [Curtobacterium sp. 1310]